MPEALIRALRLKPAARYPADPRAVFILALSVFSGLIAVTFQFAPQSLNSILPEWGVLIWGTCLLGGSVLTLAGMTRQTVDGIVVEQVGSVLVGVTTIFYAVLAISQVGFTAIQGIGIILAWGLSCFYRWGQLQALLVQTYHTKITDEATARVLRGHSEDGRES